MGNVITRQQKGGVLDSIFSQYMKVNDIHVRNETTREHKKAVLDSISSQYMKVNDIHVQFIFSINLWPFVAIFQ